MRARNAFPTPVLSLGRFAMISSGFNRHGLASNEPADGDRRVTC